MGNPRIENWSITATTINRYIAPEQKSYMLLGFVYNHPVERHGNGKTIQTSAVQELNLKEGTARTKNTTYSLGEPNKEWVQWLRDNGYNKINEFLEQLNEPANS
jgi:hypothetical protein